MFPLTAKNAAGEFWYASAFTDDISLIPQLDPQNSGGTLNYGLNALKDNSAPFSLLPVNADGLEVTGTGNLLGGAVAGEWDVNDDINFTLRATIPEASSICVWLTILGMTGLWARFGRTRVNG